LGDISSDLIGSKELHRKDNGRSMEAEVRSILSDTVRPKILG